MGRGDRVVLVSTAPSSLYLDALGVQVSSVGELEAILKLRLEAPPERYASFVTLDDATLATAHVTTERAVEYLHRTLLTLREDALAIDEVLAQLPRDFFSEDHGWRVMFDELGRLDASYAQFKRLALARYRGYLVGCLNALARIRDERAHSQPSARGHTSVDPTSEHPFLTTQSDLNAHTNSDAMHTDVVRLPSGRTVSIQACGGVVPLWLGRRRFQLEVRSQPELIDDSGLRFQLCEGRNVVGRDFSSEVVVNANFRDVSRRHVIIDVRDARPVALTDLSTLGTFVARAHLSEVQSEAMYSAQPEEVSGLAFGPAFNPSGD